MKDISVETIQEVHRILKEWQWDIPLGAVSPKVQALIKNLQDRYPNCAKYIEDNLGMYFISQRGLIPEEDLVILYNYALQASLTTLLMLDVENRPTATEHNQILESLDILSKTFEQIGNGFAELAQTAPKRLSTVDKIKKLFKPEKPSLSVKIDYNPDNTCPTKTTEYIEDLKSHPTKSSWIR